MFENVKALAIPEGEVVKIESNGSVLWELIENVYSPNKVPHSIDTNGNILNGVGYVGKTRLSSSGSTKEQTYASTTGYMQASSGAVVRVPAEYFEGTSAYVCAYNSSFGFISAVNANGDYGGGTVATNGNIKEITLLNNSNIAYIRVSMMWASGDTGYAGSANPIQGPCENMIVTVNEELII